MARNLYCKLAILILWSLCSVGVDTESLLAETIVAWVSESTRYTSRGLQTSCRTLIPVPKYGQPIPLPPDKMEIYIGRAEGEYFITLSFDTAAVDQDSCSASLSITVIQRKTGIIHREETRNAHNRYKMRNKCIYDTHEIPNPSRTITASIYPVTDEDLMIWECSAIWQNRNLSAPPFIHNITPQWDTSLSAELRYPEVQVIPRTGSESMKVACVVSNLTLPSLKPSVSNRSVLPQLDVQFSRKRDGLIDSVVYRDIYGRYSRTTGKPTVMGAPQYECTDEEYHDELTHCLGEDPADVILPDSGELGCHDLTLVAAIHASKSSRIARIPPDIVLDVSSLLQNFLSAFESPDRTPFLVHNFNKRHIVIQLPSDAGIRPLKMHSDFTYRQVSLIPNSSQYIAIRNYITHLMPDAELVSSFYAAVIQGIFERPLLKGLKIETFMENGLSKARMTCGPNGGRLIFIASVVCNVSDERVANESDTYLTMNDTWCGEKGGRYTVRVLDLDDGEEVIITKRRLMENDTYKTEMNCVWRQYYCVTGTRTKQIKSLRLLHPFPEEMGYVHVPWYGRQVHLESTFITPWEVISPDMCPRCENRFDSPSSDKINVPLILQAVDTENIRTRIKYVLQETLPSLRNLRIDEDVFVSQLSFGCTCRQKMSLCNNDNIRGLVGYTIINPDDMKFDDKLICDVMGRKSSERLYEELLVEYVCGNPIIVNADFRRLVYFLPRPILHINNSTEMSENGQQYVRLSCLNIRKRCINSMKEVNETEIITEAEINIRLFHHEFGYGVVAYFPLTKLIEWREYHPDVPYVSKYNVTTTDTSFDMPIWFVDNPVTDFNGDLPFEILIKTSILKNYEEGWCMYLNSWNTSKKKKIPNFPDLCTNDDYAITSYKTLNDSTFFICEMPYDNILQEKCDMSTLDLLIIHLPDGEPSKTLVRCPGNEHDERSTKLPFEFSVNFNNSGRGYCVYDTKNRKNIAIVALSTIRRNGWHFVCVLRRIGDESHLINLPTQNDDAENVSCVIPPSVFKPKIKVVNKNETGASTVLACSLPDWVHEPCQSNTFRLRDVLIYTETSANQKNTNREAIAILRVDGTCSSHPEHRCRTKQTSNFNDARVLMEVDLYDSALYDIAGEQGAVLKVGCAMEDVQYEEKEIVLTDGLARIMTSKKTTPFGETSLRKPTPFPLGEKYTTIATIYLVVVTISLLIMPVVVVVVTTINRRRPSNK